MKTKRLIELLQEADPSGELECCIHNQDILGVHTMAAYWDGCLQVLERDPAKAPYYDVVGGRFVAGGDKLKIIPHGIFDAIDDNYEFPVSFDGDYTRNHYAETVEKRRVEVREMEQGIELGWFAQWVGRKVEELVLEADRAEVNSAAHAFFATQGWTDHRPFPDDFQGLVTRSTDAKGREWEHHPSYVDMRSLQWDREVEAAVVDDRLTLTLREQAP